MNTPLFADTDQWRFIPNQAARETRFELKSSPQRVCGIVVFSQSSGKKYLVMLYHNGIAISHLVSGVGDTFEEGFKECLVSLKGYIGTAQAFLDECSDHENYCHPECPIALDGVKYCTPAMHEAMRKDGWKCCLVCGCDLRETVEEADDGSN